MVAACYAEDEEGDCEYGGHMGTSLLNSEIPDEVWEAMDKFFTEDWDPDDLDSIYLLPALVKHFGLPREMYEVASQRIQDCVDVLWADHCSYLERNDGFTAGN